MARTKKPDRTGELEDDLKERDRRISDLKTELEEERDLTHRLAEQVSDCNNMVDNWIQVFEIVPNEEGVWTWRSSFAERQRMRDALPKKIHELRATGDELLKEAKGLGRTRAGS
jgi:chromosome segregation ATPase